MMEFFKKTTHWCYCGDAKIIDGKIVYTRYKGCRGYIGPGSNPSYDEILERERNSMNDNNVLCGFLTLLPNEDIPEGYEIISKSEYKTDKIKEEFIQEKNDIDERNRMKGEKFNQELNKVKDILKETSQKLSFLFDIDVYERLFDSDILSPTICSSRQNEFEYEQIPSNFYQSVISLRILLPWNSPEGHFVRENYMQETFLDYF